MQICTYKFHVLVPENLITSVLKKTRIAYLNANFRNCNTFSTLEATVTCQKTEMISGKILFSIIWRRKMWTYMNGCFSTFSWKFLLYASCLLFVHFEEQQYNAFIYIFWYSCRELRILICADVYCVHNKSMSKRMKWTV